jgi:hypothetical protein
MQEIKLRFTLAGKALNGEYNIPDQGALEFSYLQTRLICELIALACIAAHGDDPRSKTKRMTSEYRAD